MKLCQLLLLVLLTIEGFAQNKNRSELKVCDLPADLSESSGLIVEGPNMFWSINDSGNDAELIAFDSNGQIVHQIDVKGAVNKDWETLAKKGDTFLIGDVGNNRNKRKDLRFLLVNRKGKMLEVLSFKYEDQNQFPPPKANMNFDMEASFYRAGHIYMFSKTRVPDNKHTKIYELPVKPFKKNLEANLLDSLNIKTAVTGATKSASNNILLMSYGKIYRLSSFNLHDWECVKIDNISIPISQTEGIGRSNGNDFYYTDEQGNLFKHDVKAFD